MSKAELELPAPAVPWDPALRPFLIACREAFANAAELERDATRLFAHGRYARALALAVTGQEELGKACLLWLIGLGVVPESNRKEVLKVVRTQHQAKQAVGIVLALTGELVSLARRIRIPMPRRRPRNWDQAAAWLIRKAPQVSALCARLVPRILGDATAIDAWINAVNAGELETRRRQALYTDLEGQGVRSPTVKRGDAFKILRQLRAGLRTRPYLADLANFDDKMMNAVSYSIEFNRRLWDSPDVEAMPAPAPPIGQPPV